MSFDARGRMFPTGQVWPQGIEDVGDGRFRMKLDKDTLSIPGLAKSGNYLTMHGGPGGFEVNQNHGVTIEHVRGYCGGEVSGPQGDSKDRFINMRGMRRPGTNRLFSGIRYFQVGISLRPPLGGSWILNISSATLLKGRLWERDSKAARLRATHGFAGVHKGSHSSPEKMAYRAIQEEAQYLRVCACLYQKSQLI